MEMDIIDVSIYTRIHYQFLGMHRFNYFDEYVAFFVSFYSR